MKKLKNLTREERSLLLFFESACVERGGFLKGAHMNEADHAIARRWVAEKFCTFSRIPFVMIKQGCDPITHDVWLSPAAWKLAQQERRARAGRIRRSRS